MNNVDVAGTYGPIDRKQLFEMMKTGELDTLIVGFVDIQGRLMGKRLTADYCLETELVHGSKFCTYLLGTDLDLNTIEGYSYMSWETGYGDWIAEPDWATLNVLPWQEKTALVFADVINEERKDVPISPRSILKKQIERANDKGLFPKMVSELEFYLFNESFESAFKKDYRDLQIAGQFNEDYSLLQGSKNEPFYRHIRNMMTKAGVPIESSKGEAHIGQHEINLKYGDALTSADRHILLKHGMKEMAIQQDYALTFTNGSTTVWITKQI
ncbi:hypothetical protein [Geomicrobium sediminis]|uniref:Glutamine synthetase n=1 Tax=Geomicrobium sediminis TaxID=1347788 RepID=A0ABS2PG74_9BACL|nr:hypothetical protein [Geomicrobium sediminis]MBM7633981.1 glutamine synthetase [Geomicrobium sediminis]